MWRAYFRNDCIPFKQGASIFKMNSMGINSLSIIAKYELLRNLSIFSRKIVNDFYHAVKNGIFDQIEETLKYFPKSVNCRFVRSEGGFTTQLMLALSKGDPNVIQIILQRGANILAIDSEGSDPIEAAIGSDIYTVSRRFLLKIA